jgi:hypothetical protein
MRKYDEAPIDRGLAKALLRTTPQRDVGRRARNLAMICKNFRSHPLLNVKSSVGKTVRPVHPGDSALPHAEVHGHAAQLWASTAVNRVR